MTLKIFKIVNYNLKVVTAPVWAARGPGKARSMITTTKNRSGAVQVPSAKRVGSNPGC